MPLVATMGGAGSGMRPLSASTTPLVRRACAEAEEVGDLEVLEGLNTESQSGSTPWTVGEGGEVMKMVGAAKYITLKVGTFPDLCEDLIDMHLGRGDTVAAMVVCEKMNADLPRFGWTQLRHAELMHKLNDNRPLEVRDCAKTALWTLPMWSMGSDTSAAVERLLDLADGVPTETDGSGFIMRTVADLGAFKLTKSKDMQKDKLKQGETTPEQIALDRADSLMDAVALGAAGAAGNWRDVAFLEELASFCDEGYCKEAAAFVRS
uniref:Uncharacterized protein n=1 Tax=Eutreptiella gymnastica TaxID=73025 RepID=A0A7S1I1X5_9EUGL